MIVTPQTNVQIMRGIPWANDYKHTRYFHSETLQNEYFTARVVKTFQNCTYVREQNVIRLSVNADELYNCNYLRYMNAGFGSKWFYAFITDVKYINTETTEIAFEIDEFQTWWFNVTIGHCYVEREHVADDTIGLHVIDEGLGTGELTPQIVYERYWKKDPFSTETKDAGYNVVVQAKPTLLGDFIGDDPFDWKELQVVPLTEVIDDPSNADAVNDFCKDRTLSGYELGDAYMIPKEFVTSGGQKDLTKSEMQAHGLQRPTSFDWSPAIRNQLAYTPKNNKLFTYPYTKLVVTSSSGGKQEYKWENTADGVVTFSIISNVYNKPSCALVASNYFDKSAQRFVDVPISEFPKVAFTQYDSMTPKNLINTLTRVGGAVASGNVAGAMTEIANSATGLLTDTGKGDPATLGDNLLLRARWIGYVFYVMSITAQNAKVIDDYLTRFGYKVNTIKMPELHSRKRWNYVKTKECEIHAKSSNGAPTSALQRIQDMFNAGVTLWHVNDVGDFTGDNGILT